MACFITYLSEAGDEHCPDQIQDGFMLLKRAKRLLTSTVPLTEEALFPNRVEIQHKTDGNKWKRVNQHSVTNSPLLQYLCNNKHCYHRLQNIKTAMDMLNKPVIPLKLNVLKSKKTLVQSCQADMTWTLVLEHSQRIWMFGLREPQQSTVSTR